VKLGFVFVGHENIQFQVIATTLVNYNIRLLFAYTDFFAKFFAFKPEIFCTMAKGKYSNFKDTRYIFVKLTF
jgi:hypothetical protein